VVRVFWFGTDISTGKLDDKIGDEENYLKGSETDWLTANACENFTRRVKRTITAPRNPGKKEGGIV